MMDSTENRTYLGRQSSYRQKRKSRPIQFDYKSDQQIPTVVFSEDEDNPYKSELSPCQKIQMLFGKQDIVCDVHPIFTEMLELKDTEPQSEWNETARWVKFEEAVEVGGNRWSKPHVATLSLHSWFEFRSFIANGMVLLGFEASNLREVIDDILDRLTKAENIDDEQKDKLRQILFRKLNHQYEQSSKYPGRKIMSKVRSIAEIGRQYSKEHTSHHGSVTTISSIADSVSQLDENKFQKSIEMHKGHRKNSIKDFLFRESSFTGSLKSNSQFKRKLPPDAEAANVFVGHLNFIDSPISVFVRLNNSSVMGDLCEVSIPTRFLYLLLCPIGREHQYHEIGRAFGAIMTDEVFHAVAYKARCLEDLLDGIDEFLDQVTILPPGEWDPDIRIEPPTTLPDMSKRIIPASHHSGVSSDEDLSSDDESVKPNILADPTLQRTGRMFGCLINDISRKLPFYKSDFIDALNVHSLATFFYMYFALLAPIVTFGGLYKESTGWRIAVVESILSCSITGVLFALFAAQPLAILSSTGPTLVFEKIMFDMCQGHLDYLAFRYWINMWSAIILFAVVAFDGSTIVGYVTRFTEENFTVLVSFIFIIKAVSRILKGLTTAEIIAFDKVALIRTPYCSCVESIQPYNISFVPLFGSVSPYSNKTLVDGPLGKCLEIDGTMLDDPFGHCYFMYDVFLMSLILAVGSFSLSYFFKFLKNSIYFPTLVRQFFSLFGVIIAIILMVLLDHWVGLATPKLYVPDDFRPTWHDRNWVVDPFNGNPWWTVILAIVPAFLLCILIFMDHNVTLVVVNRQENKLKKGCGYHLDLFILCFGIIISGIFGLPIFVAATVMSISHVKALRIENECSAPGEKPTIVGIREQRLTSLLAYIFIGLSMFFRNVLTYIPMAVLYGVFLYMGITALEGVQMIDRLMLFITPAKYQPDYMYLRHVPMNRVHLFTCLQLACFIVMFIVKEINIISLIFPLILVGTVVVRKLMDHIFTQEELQYLDDQMPEVLRRETEDVKKTYEDDEYGHDGGLKHEEDIHIELASGNVLRIPKSNIIDNTSHDMSSSIRNHGGIGRNSLKESNLLVRNSMKESNLIARNSLK